MFSTENFLRSRLVIKHVYLFSPVLIHNILKLIGYIPLRFGNKSKREDPPIRLYPFNVFFKDLLVEKVNAKSIVTSNSSDLGKLSPLRIPVLLGFLALIRYFQFLNNFSWRNLLKI